MLVKEDIERKKKALEDEKSLIDERLNKRKQAEDEALKYEKLAEYEKQLNRISADPTRTKEAAQLRNQISDLRREIGWDLAEQEANAEKENLQDQIDSYTQYINDEEEALNKFLENANNFADEVNRILKMSQKDLFDWLKENVKDYANSLEAQQQQMLTKWEDTYDQMLHIVHTYWDEVNQILSSKEAYLSFMQMSDEFLYASQTMKEQLIYDWNEAFDALRNAAMDTFDWIHNEDFSFGSGAATSSGGSGSGGGGGGGGGGSNNNTVTTAPVSVQIIDSGSNQTHSTSSPWDTTSADYYVVDDASGKPVFGPATKADCETWMRRNYGDGHGRVLHAKYVDTNYDGRTHSQAQYVADARAKAQASLAAATKYYHVFNSSNQEIGKFTSQSEAQKFLQNMGVLGAGGSIYYYKHGGLINSTGPVWVDGSTLEPESINDAALTKLLKEATKADTLPAIADMLEAMKYVYIDPLNTSVMRDDTAQRLNVGDVTITINEAQINDDADIADLADRLGDEFLNRIGKSGLMTGNYSF